MHDIPPKLDPTILRSRLATAGGWKHVKALERVLAILSRDSVGCEPLRPAMVCCDCVLSETWAPDRLSDVLSALDSSIELPPILVSEAFWQGTAFYLLMDGNHRTEGAKLRGHSRISAQICGSGNCITDGCLVTGLTLYRDGIEQVHDLSSIEIKLLRALGVEFHWSLSRWLRDSWTVCREKRAMPSAPRRYLRQGEIGESDTRPRASSPSRRRNHQTRIQT